MSRVSDRYGTKSLSCPDCGRGEGGRMVLQFRGRSAARLAQHKQEVHGADRRKVLEARKAKRGGE